MDSQAAGNFSTNHSLRSAIAVLSYLTLTSSEAIYPDWRNDSSASCSAISLSLTTDESYLYMFSANSPISGACFWNLTAYGEDNYLIPNELGVYASGDRSNLTYPSGQSVYGNSQEAEHVSNFWTSCRCEAAQPLDGKLVAGASWWWCYDGAVAISWW